RGAGIVNGMVMDGATTPAPGAVVALVPEEKRFANRALFATAVSDASGQFAFRGVAPGDYRLLAWESTPPNAYQNAVFLKKYDGKAHVVHLGQSGTVSASLTLIK